MGLLITMMVGTLGTAIGLLLICIVVMRAHLGPRWVSYALGGFIVVEFVGTGFTAWASLVSGILYRAAFVAFAMALWRSSPFCLAEHTIRRPPGAPPQPRDSRIRLADDPATTAIHAG